MTIIDNSTNHADVVSLGFIILDRSTMNRVTHSNDFGCSNRECRIPQT